MTADQFNTIVNTTQQYLVGTSVKGRFQTYLMCKAKQGDASRVVGYVTWGYDVLFTKEKGGNSTLVPPEWKDGFDKDVWNSEGAAGK